MRVSAEAMNAALRDFADLQYPTKVVSAYEAYLTAKWIEAHGLELGFNEVNQAVSALFELIPGNSLGRLRPFRYDWQTSFNSGRKTVWNNNSRKDRPLSSTLFVDNDIRNGLVPNAASLLEAMLPISPGGTRVKPKRESLAALVLRDYQFPDGATWADAEDLLKQQLALSEDELAAIAWNVPLNVPLLGEVEWSLDTLAAPLRPQVTVTITAPEVPKVSVAAPESPNISVQMDDRVERMLRLALSAYSSILLVGPPGTGKGTLLKWLIGKVKSAPEEFGFDASFDPDPLWRTPDESWTAFDLVGGLAPDQTGALKWAPGALTNAITENRWLVLDETNRADMDKIMGPLLTWLTKQEVELGRTKPSGGSPVRLGWSTDHESVEKKEIEPPALRYLAGRDWRLLGTYNPQDAQRVFRFGQALSRRFVIVPVPTLKPGQFSKLLSDSYPGLPEPVADAITGIYSAHLAQPDTTLGPAVFLGMARYMLAGRLPDDEDISLSTTAGELLAEAYTLGLGKYVAAYDDIVFQALGKKIVDEESALSQEQWTWIEGQRNVLG
jgi:MoxR-like ATPase